MPYDPNVPGYEPMKNLGWIALLQFLPSVSVFLTMISTTCFILGGTAEVFPVKFRIVLLLAGLAGMLTAALASSFAGLKTRQLLLRAEYERRFARD